MTLSKFSPFVLGMILLPLLFVAGAQNAAAQTREDQFKELITLLKDQIADKNKDLADKDTMIKELRAQLKDFQALDRNSAATVAVLQEQVKNLQETRMQLQTQMDARDVIIREQNARIANRDQAIELVKELSRAGKRTTWEKLAEAIPSVAGILALALAR